MTEKNKKNKNSKPSEFMGFDHVTNPYLYPDINPKIITYFL